MRVRIGICLLAVAAATWPLLAAAAPGLVPESAPACCRRDGEHHCGKATPAETAVTGVCPYAGRQQKFAGVKSARPSGLIVLSRWVGSRAIPFSATRALPHFDPSQASSRAPPFA